MALTRAALEAKLVSRTRALLLQAGMAVTTVGTNSDLADAIVSALHDGSYDVADEGTPGDVDLSAVANADTNKLIDLAHLRLLETIRTNLVVSSQSMGPLSKSFNLSGIDKAITDLRDSINTRYGVFVQPITGGVIVTSTRPSVASGVD